MTSNMTNDNINHEQPRGLNLTDLHYSYHVPWLCPLSGLLAEYTFYSGGSETENS